MQYSFQKIAVSFFIGMISSLVSFIPAFVGMWVAVNFFIHLPDGFFIAIMTVVQIIIAAITFFLIGESYNKPYKLHWLWIPFLTSFLIVQILFIVPIFNEFTS